MSRLTFDMYIEEFYNKDKFKDDVLPGEHHFVSIYLVPLLVNELNVSYRNIKHVNPDGTKNIEGDITYSSDQIPKRTIEVKYAKDIGTKISFSRKQISLLIKRLPLANYCIALGVRNKKVKCIQIDQESLQDLALEHVKNCIKKLKRDIPNSELSQFVLREGKYKNWKKISDLKIDLHNEKFVEMDEGQLVKYLMGN